MTEAAAPVDLAAGTRLGPYQIIGLLGAGGMGRVYRAKDTRLGREVAVKVVAGISENRASELQRFEIEARAAGSLNHPNILAVYDVGTHEGAPYLVSELLEGATLRQRLALEPLPPGKALELAIQLADGLAAAHGHGVVHRDLKPENLFVSDGDGRLKILDFGIAKLVGESAGERITQTGGLLGTIGYMSPEQLRGEPADQRSDLFAFGLVLFEMLTGRSPFARATPLETGHAILKEELPSLPASVPPELARLLRRCLEKNRSERIQSAQDLAFDLRAIATSTDAGRRPSRPAGGSTEREGGRPGSFLEELNRRRVIRAVVGYGIAAFAVLQIAEPIMHGLRWPEAVLSYVVLGLAIGFPLVVSLAWIFDVKAGRIERTPASPGMPGARLLIMLGAIGLLAAAPGLAWYFLLRPRPPSAAAGEDRRSIAVLPFTSLSAGDENKYFADAIHIDLLSQLAKISDLKVISRTSVLQYKEGTRSVREIGGALGVASVLEGSVQRAGNRVRIQVQLIDAASDRELWASRYDRELTDLFLIQTAVAEEISKELHARLLPEERNRIARQPTANAEAYALYLRGWETFNRLGWVNDLSLAEQLFRKALELDPAFALARARLSFLHSQAYWFNQDHTEARIAQAKDEAERALALQPDLPEAHLARGIYSYWGKRDYGRALQEFEIARRSVPDVVQYIAYVERRQGRFEDARRDLSQAVTTDPRNALMLIEFVSTLIAMRRYQEAAAAIERLATLAPDAARAARAQLLMLWKGDVEPGKAILQDLAHAPASRWTETWMPQPALAEMLEVVPQETLSALPAAPPIMAGSDYYRPKPLIEALTREALGEVAQARAGYEAARVELEAAVAKDPEDAVRRAALARAYAGLDRKGDALREARRAVELRPVSKDALTGPLILEELAAVEARNGDAEAALDVLTILVAIPCRISPQLLRIDPQWNRLHGNPRFQQLIRTSP